MASRMARRSSRAFRSLTAALYAANATMFAVSPMSGAGGQVVDLSLFESLFRCSFCRLNMPRLADRTRSAAARKRYPRGVTERQQVIAVTGSTPKMAGGSGA